ncbi:unnamed protein product [Agarophyton chilense]
MEHGHHAQVRKLFNFIHVAISDDDWLPAAFNHLFPRLLHYYDLMLAKIEQVADPEETPPNIYRLRKCSLQSLRLIASIFELCVDFCDVVYAGDQLSGFLKPLISLLGIPDFHETSPAITETEYAMIELLRSASFALSNFLITFTSLAAETKSVTRQQVDGLFETLSNAPELSIQRSLLLIIRSLYNDTDIRKNSSHPGQNLASMRQIIDKKLSTTQFGSGRASACFRALKLDDEDFLVKYESLIKMMFSRRRKALRCFSVNPCHVEIWEGPSKRRTIIESAFVEWNMNSVCVRDQGGNPVQNWPFFAAVRFEWLNAEKEISLIFDMYYSFPVRKVLLQFERTIRRNDRKIIEERIERIQSLVPKESTPKASETDPMQSLGHLVPVTASLTLKSNGKSPSSEELSENSDMSSESEQQSDGNRVDTALSGLREDGIFIRKQTGSRAESVVESCESTLSSAGEEPNPSRPSVEESSAESTGVHDSFRDRQNVHNGEGKAPSEPSASVVCGEDEYSSRAPAERKLASHIQSLHSGPRVLRTGLRVSENRVECGKHRLRNVRPQNPPSPLDDNSHSRGGRKKENSCSQEYVPELKDDEMKDVECESACLEESRPNSAKSNEENALEEESRRLRRRRRVSIQVPSKPATDGEPISDGKLNNRRSKDHHITDFSSTETVNESKELELVVRRTRRDKGEPRNISEGASKMDDENDGFIDQHHNIFRDALAAYKYPGFIKGEDITDPLDTSREEDINEDVDNENERMRQILMGAVERMMKCQVDKSQKMFMATQSQVRLLRTKKVETRHCLIKDYVSKVKNLGEEQKKRFRDHASTQGVTISKARKRVRDLRLRLSASQKQMNVLKQKMRRLVEQSSKQLKSIAKKMDEDLAELVASNKKKDERLTKGSFVQNLMSILGKNHKLA